MARSVRNFLEVLDDLTRLNISFVSFRENIDTDSALGRAMIVIVGAISESEVKEKFGGLRFYVNYKTEDIDRRIGIAAEESFRTCEVCGQPGKLREDSFIKALCDEHDASARGARGGEQNG